MKQPLANPGTGPSSDPSTGPGTGPDTDVTSDSVLDRATDVVLVVSRLLVGVAAKSLAATEDRVTLVQYRALATLASSGEQNVGALADALGIHGSTATRLCDRLIANGFIDRATSKRSRREVTLALSEKGRALVRAENASRRGAIRDIVARLAPEDQRQVVDVFGALTGAADAGSDHAWRLGWTA